MTSRKQVMLDKTRYLRAFGNEGLKHIELWFLSLYLDRSKPSFLDQAETVRQMFPDRDSRYHTAYGCRLRSLLDPYIEKWLDEDGMSVVRVKEKLHKLMTAKQTKFQKIKGVVDRRDLPAGVRIVVAGETQGKLGGIETETLVAMDTDNLELQLRVVENLARMKGMNAPDKIEVSGLGDVVAKLQEARNKTAMYRDEPLDMKRVETIEDDSDTWDFMGDDDDD